jgi:hypothetical protein
MKHLTEEELILFYYEEGKDRSAVFAHLEACDSCRAAYQRLQHLLLRVNAPPMPELGEAEATAAWNRLRPCLDEQKAFRWSDLLQFYRWPRWAMAGVFAFLLLTAFLGGRYWTRPVPAVLPTVAVLTPGEVTQARERILSSQIGHTLERAQVALIELVHSRTSGPVNIVREQALARQLVEMNRLCRQSALRLGNTRMTIVLEDLERTLIEIANSPDSLSLIEFADLCRRIDSEQMLFKVRVVSADLRAKERDAARELAGKSL